MSNTVEVRAPSDQSEGTRSQVSRWLKAVGEPVEEHEPLIEVETDKVTVEISAPAGGVLHEILKQEQEDIEPGELLGTIRTGVPEQPSDQAQLAQTGSDVPAGISAQTGAAGAPGLPRARAGTDTTAAALAAHASMASRISPAVRRLLSERGLQPSQVQGTGAGGRITVQDVLNHAARGAPTPSSPASGTRGAGEPHVAPAGSATEAPVRRIPHTAMRKRIAERMVASLLHTAPHVTSLFEVDLGAVLAHRDQHRAEFEQRGASLTLTSYFLAACVEAIREVPEANSRWTDEALELWETIDIGVGTAVAGKGLVVPVVRDVQRRDLYSIARELGELVARAREDKLTVADVRGGTFTISNHGVSGSLLATPIVINQPQSAILGVGKLEKRAVVVSEGGEDRIVVRPRCYVTLTIDHRVMDGHRANRFLQVLIERLERWS